MTRALVLGGGGPVGVAWEIGLAAGLEQGGVRLADADLIIGTSAGSIVGAMLAFGRPGAELFATQHAIERDATPRGTANGAFDLAPLMQQFMKLYTSDAPPQQLRAEIGRFALDANVAMTEEEWIATFQNSEMIARGEWPERAYACTAVDAETGEFVTWTKDSGVPLDRAIASSCCVPGIFPPITINGRRYIDGGMKSATNADIAAGYERVVVVSVTSGMERRAAAFPAMAERAKKRMDEEMAAITSAGGRTEMIVPDAESAETMGMNLMDFKRRGEIADAGLRQGKLEASRLRDFWR
ncbi:MAG TPA: patatin-like phospholipase family protein [Dehalococcoidia bacterium]|nr:patatin-like phospholipase family protein [Dehalococcoidia bacterium]